VGLSRQEIDDDVTASDTATLYRFFAGYLASHTHTGTSTVQRNLSHLFTRLQETYTNRRPGVGGALQQPVQRGGTGHAQLPS
jgi:hypothetical protein